MYTNGLPKKGLRKNFIREFVMKNCFFEILCYRGDSFDFCDIAHVKVEVIRPQKI